MIDRLKGKSPVSHLICLTLALLIFIPQTMPGKGRIVKNTDPQMRLKWYDQHVNMKDTSLFKNLEWQFVGPINISGRMTDVDVVAPKGEHYTIYVAGASGGVWRTVNEGTTWEAVFQHAPSTSIGDVTIAPSNHKIIWVGTGEANIFRSSMAGAGVFKSINGGETWEHLGLTATHTIARIVIHPKNPDVVYVAASGHEWTDNPERGVYKTADGGKTWDKVLFVNDKTGAIDLVMDPGDPDTLYTATWQRRRKKYNDPRNEEGYSGSGIYKTEDGGRTWRPINEGLPAARYRGRIGIDLCRSKPNVLYAFVDNYEIIGDWPEGETDSYGRPKEGMIKGATVYRSDDHGANWKLASQNNEFMQRLSATYGWVFGQIRVDPHSENTIYVMGLALNVSDDGGKTFRRLPGMHGDHHGLWIAPHNSDYLVNVNDGGVAISYDRGKNWRTFYDNLPLVQFFNVMVDMADPFRVYGSIQDHGSYRGTVDLSRGRGNVPAVEFEDAPGGEGSHHAIDPTDVDTVYSAGFYGTLSRTDMKTGQSELIVPRPGEGEPRYRGQWLAPFIISPHNPRIIYHGMNHLFRSMNRGETWERISPDLTHNDPRKAGDIPYQTIFSISESPFKFGLIYVGTDDGRAHVTHDGGRTWKEITRGLAAEKWISRVQASAFDDGTVYLAQNGKRDDDLSAYLWKSTDYGKTWIDISGNIPCGPINVVREDPVNGNVLYVGTDLGAYVTLDGGKNWQVLAKCLPTTFVHDLMVHPRENMLVAATHGRGIYVMDVRNLQKLNSDVIQSPLHLFESECARLPRWRWWRWTGGRKARFDYYLKETLSVTATITDSDGQRIAEVTGDGDPGLNTLEWNLIKEQVGETLSGRNLPYVKPGTYTVTIKAGPHTQTGNVVVKKSLAR